jgi:hypothetical protein
MDILFKDDVTGILLGGVPFMIEEEHFNCGTFAKEKINFFVSLSFF